MINEMTYEPILFLIKNKIVSLRMLVIRIYLPYSTLNGKKQDKERNPGGYFENQQLCHQPVH